MYEHLSFYVDLHRTATSSKRATLSCASIFAFDIRALLKEGVKMDGIKHRRDHADSRKKEGVQGVYMSQTTVHRAFAGIRRPTLASLSIKLIN